MKMVEKILSELQINNDFAQFIILLSAGCIILNILLALIFRGQRWVKYLPALGFLIFGVIKFLGIGSDFLSSQNLPDLLVIMVSGVLFVVALCSAWIIALVTPRRS